MPNFVQLYRSTDTGAPVITGEVGKANVWLQAVLVDGYTPAAVTSITEAGSVYTVTTGAQNLLAGNYVKIAGCTGAFTALNGVWGPISITSSTVFTFAGPGGLGTPATGSITWAKAPLGWTNPFATASNVGTYKAASVTGRTVQPILRVDDNGSNATPSYRECQVRGYLTMSDKDTGTEPFPTIAQMAAPGLVWRKATALNATARPWTLIGDGATFYFVIDSDASTTQGRHLQGFGGFASYKAGDAYNAFISGAMTSNVAQPSNGNQGMGTAVGFGYSTIYSGVYAPRSHTQIGTSVGMSVLVPFGSIGANASPLGNTTVYPSLPYPHPVDGAIWISPLLWTETGGATRGKVSGLYVHMHTSHPCAEGDQVTTVAGLSGVTLRALAPSAVSSAACLVLADEFGAW